MRIKLDDSKVFRVEVQIGIDENGIHPLPSDKYVKRIMDSISNPRARERYQEAVENQLSGYENMTTEWAEFSHWGWGDKLQLNTSAVTENAITGNQRRDVYAYQREKFRRLFRGWSIELTDENDEPIELKFDGDGSLTEESMKLLEGSPELSRLLDAFIEEADSVWELGEQPSSGGGVLGGSQPPNSSDSSDCGLTPPEPETKT